MMNDDEIWEMACEAFPGGAYDETTAREGYAEGFKAHQELVKDKFFTVDDIREVMQTMSDPLHIGHLDWIEIQNMIEEIIESKLPKSDNEIKENT